MAARSKAPKPSAGRQPLYGKVPTPTERERVSQAAKLLAAQKPKSLIERIKAWFKEK